MCGCMSDVGCKSNEQNNNYTILLLTAVCNQMYSDFDIKSATYTHLHTAHSQKRNSWYS